MYISLVEGTLRNEYNSLEVVYIVRLAITGPGCYTVTYVSAGTTGNNSVGAPRLDSKN